MKEYAKRVAMMIVLIVALVGCGKKEETVTIDVDQLADQLKDGIEFQDEMNVVDGEMFPLLYDVEESSVVRNKVYVSSGATAEEIFVAEATDTQAASDIKKVLEQHIEDQKSSFESYIPEEMVKLKDPVLQVKGNYVILCISNENDTANKIIEEYK